MSKMERASRVVVLSADGMRPDFYRKADKFGLKIPHLRKLVASGASADVVESVYPSTTYPAHATLVTGVRPRKHGIYSHLASLDPTEKARPWAWFARAIDVPTLWDVAEASGRKTAAIAWPVSAGARITYNIPEIWDPAAPDPHRDFATPARHSTPRLFNEVLSALRSASPRSSRPQIPVHEMPADHLRAEAGIYLWTRYHPDLLLVHFADYDLAAHQSGPFASKALEMLEKMDAEIGHIGQIVNSETSTTLVVLSDHGFVPVEQEASPLVALVEEGLLGQNAHGEPELKRLGAIHSGGSFAFYWLDEPTGENRRALQRAVERLVAAGAVREVLDRQKLEILGADPDAELMLDAAPQFYFSGRSAGPLVRQTLTDHGTHGHTPSFQGMEAAFIAAGPGIKHGKNLGRISLTQVAPTLAERLGLTKGVIASEAEALDLA